MSQFDKWNKLNTIQLIISQIQTNYIHCCNEKGCLYQQHRKICQSMSPVFRQNPTCFRVYLYALFIFFYFCTTELQLYNVSRAKCILNASSTKIEKMMVPLSNIGNAACILLEFLGSFFRNFVYFVKKPKLFFQHPLHI